MNFWEKRVQWSDCIFKTQNENDSNVVSSSLFFTQNVQQEIVDFKLSVDVSVNGGMSLFVFQCSSVMNWRPCLCPMTAGMGSSRPLQP